jgi:NAD+ kinase
VIRVVHDGSASPAARAASLLRDRDAAVTVTETAALAAEEFDADDRVLALGECALIAVARAGVECPVLPVGGESLPTGPTVDELDAAADTLLAPDPDVVRHPTLSVDGDRHRGRAVLDATLVTSEPARISEYAITTEGRLVDRFRADGVVVATPLGSGGYASAVGGPLLGPGTGLVVVPISPFETQRDCWVVDGPVALSVERDDSEVSLIVDDEEAGHVTPGERLSVAVDDHFAVIRDGSL